MAIRVQDAYTSFQRFKKDVSDVDLDLFSEWCDWINKDLYRKMIGTDPNRYIKSQIYNVVSGTSTYSVPTDFRSMDTYGCGIYYMNDDGTDNTRQLPRLSFGSSNTGFYIDKGNIVFTPVPNSDINYKLRYIPTITKINSIADYFTVDVTSTGYETIPDEYMRELVACIDVLYTQWDEDTGMEGVADQRFMNAMDSLANSVRKESNNFIMDDFAQDYSKIYPNF